MCQQSGCVFNNYIGYSQNMIKNRQLDRCSTSYSKESIESQILMKKENFDQEDSMIDQILFLSQTNLELAQEYFQGPSNEGKGRIFAKKTDLKDCILVDRKKLTKILSVLTKTKHILSEKFGIEAQNTKDDYRFLRNLWTFQQRKIGYLDLQDRFDGLNKVIGMIKNRVKSLTKMQILQYDQFWQKNVGQSIQMQENPTFIKLTEKISQQSMLIDELSSKLVSSIGKNEFYGEKVHEYEQRFDILKDKSKKSQKKLFQISKQKVDLQKKVFDLEVKITNKEREEKEKKIQEQISENVSEFIAKEECLPPSIVKTRKDEQNQSSLLNKYREENLYKKRKLISSSSNGILNSTITTPKFQRTSSKRSLANRSELRRC